MKDNDIRRFQRMRKVGIIEFEKNKFVLSAVFTQKQLKGFYQYLFEPLSRRWRGEYQKMHKEIVAACKEHGIKLTGRKR